MRLRVRFSGDHGATTPVSLFLRDGEPMVLLSPEARALVGQIDSDAITTRMDATEAARWLAAFNEARHAEVLTPNAACRLLLGPYYRPTRTAYQFNANVELRVDPRDASSWFPDIDPAETEWPTLSDLAERLRGQQADTTNDDVDSLAATPSRAASTSTRPSTATRPSTILATTTGSGRPDANQIALRALRAVLDASASFSLEIETKRVDVTVERLPPEPWPTGGLEGLDAAADGPLPGAVRAICRWPGGDATVLVSVGWPGTGIYRHLVSLLVRALGKQIVWSNVAVALKAATDGTAAPLSGWCALYAQRDEVAPDDKPALSRALKSVVARSGLPMLSPSRVRLFDAVIPSGQVEPSPAEAFRRVIHLTLLKLPFLVRDGEDAAVAASLLDVAHVQPGQSEGEGAVTPASTVKFGGLFPLPGGVRQYKATLDALLAWFAVEPRRPDDFIAMLRERYEVTGIISVKGYLRLLETTGFVAAGGDGFLELTESGRIYLDQPDADLLFDRLERTYSGVLETLVITAELGPASPSATKRILEDLLDVTWSSVNQTAFRRNWLLSLGLTDRHARGDVVSERGLAVLAARGEEVDRLRSEIAAIVADEPDLAIAAEVDDEEIPAVDDTTPAALSPAPMTPPAAPPSWDADRLDLTTAILGEHLAGLRMPAAVLEQACAALSAGKHLLLVGPPGNGKTKLALALASAAKAENYCHGAFLATASADWTTFDTIGGYALEKDSALRFRSGVFLAAVERWQWLLIDELNRADVDRAFGELMTVLAGGTSDTAYELPDGRTVSVGSRLSCSHRLPRTFRVIATMNTWDKTSLFRLSYAVQRRFAIIHVGIPDDATFGALIDHHADRAGFDEPLEDGAKGPIKALFQEKGLLGVRPIGPAIVEDIVAYMRRRRASGDALAEAFGMYLLPQLEGLEPEQASAVFRKLLDSLVGWTSAEATAALRAQYREVFPHVKLPEA